MFGKENAVEQLKRLKPFEKRAESADIDKFHSKHLYEVRVETTVALAKTIADWRCSLMLQWRDVLMTSLF